jgi:hypothetical protein
MENTNYYTKLITLFMISTLIVHAGCSVGQINTGKLLEKAKSSIPLPTESGSKLTNEDIIQGLKEALEVGTRESATRSSAIDGFLKNDKIKIPFPPEAEKIKTTVENMGMQSQVNQFVLTLNRAAEEAAKDAAPIFVNAIKGMSIGDGLQILKGEDNAATSYLKQKTSAQLMEKFRPVVERAIAKVEVTKHWNPIITTYNKVPFVQKMNPDLEQYVTEKAVAGLFILIAEEEQKIRKDPLARVTDILKKVFGG